MLNGKKILVIGACGLLGKALVRYLLENNALVVAVDRSSVMQGADIFDCREVDTEMLSFIPCDITLETDVKTLFSNLVGVSGAVNCTYPRGNGYGSHFFDVKLENFNNNVALHLGSSFLFMQQCAAYFLQHKAPFSLVNISSVYGVIAPVFSIYNNTSMTMPVEYAAIKSAVQHLSKYVAAYVHDSDFRVNCVSPGGILDGQPAEFLNAYRDRTHGKGMLEASDVLGTIGYLLSDFSRFVTGQNIIVDDGFTI